MEESGNYILVLYMLHRNTLQEAALSCLDTYYLVVYFSNKEIQIKKENLILSIIHVYICWIRIHYRRHHYLMDTCYLIVYFSNKEIDKGEESLYCLQYMPCGDK